MNYRYMIDADDRRKVSGVVRFTEDGDWTYDGDNAWLEG